MRRFLTSTGAVVLLLALPFIGACAGIAQPSAIALPSAEPPVFDARNFPDHANVDNPYFPLIPGTTFNYETTKGKDEHVEVFVTSESKVILGVPCLVVRDTETVGGQVTEITDDWYAQDKDGNVWYMGEESKEYKNGKVVSAGGSWEAGVDGARPGYIMKADPRVGDAYRQEYYAGEAEDMAEVLSLTASASVPYGSWNGNALQTKEWSPLEPLVIENKYYAPQVGLIKEASVTGSPSELVLVSITQQ